MEALMVTLLISAMIVSLIGFLFVYYVTRYRYWLSLLQRAAVLCIYWGVISAVMTVLVTILQSEWIYLALIVGAFLSFGIPLANYMYERNVLSALRRFRTRRERYLGRNATQLAVYSEIAVETTVNSLGKLQELRDMGFVSEEEAIG
jgi:hypothetical protein